MAKGVLHLNVEFSAVTDEEGKFGRLAVLLGLADAAHALGMCTRLWLACTRRGEADLPQWLVEQILGERGPDALVEAELASWAAGRGDSSCRRLRIGGAAKHCLWMSSSKTQLKSEQQRKGGETRAKTSSRQLDGTFAPRPADHPAPSSSSEISSASEISDPDSLPPRAIPPSVPEPAPTTPPPAPSVPAASPPPAIREDIARTNTNYAREPVSNSSLVAQSCDLVVSQATRNAPENMRDATLRASPPPAPIVGFDPLDPRAIGRLAEATWHRVSDAAISLAAELKLPAPLPFPAITPSTNRRGFVELKDRIREEGAIALAACDRVVDNLVKQARSKRSVEWLAEKAFGDKAWVNARNGVDPSARLAPGQRAGPQPAAPRPRDRDPPPKPIPRDQLAGPEQFAEARELLAKAMTSNDDDAPDEKPRRKAAT